MGRHVPKYLEVVKWIREQIAQGHFREGDRLQSESELGELFSLSRQTVRQATSVLESEGLLERRRGSGTYVISTTVKPKTRTMSVGVITTYLDDYIFPSIIHGIDKVLTENSYAMRLSITYNKVENEMRVLSALLKNDVDGIIVEPTKSGLPNLNADLYKEIKRREIPCIFINGYYPNLSFPYVAMDDYACGREAVAYLIKKNHRRIAGIFKSDDIQGHLRYEGCAKMMRKNNLLLPEDNIVWYTTEDIQPPFESSFEQRVLKRIEGCTALICYNDRIAFRVIDFLYRQGISVPQDISIIGFDDSDTGNNSQVGLTTFSHPKAELGEMAARQLLRMIGGERFEATVKFKPKFVERNSVKTL